MDVQGLSDVAARPEIGGDPGAEATALLGVLISLAKTLRLALLLLFRSYIYGF